MGEINKMLKQYYDEVAVSSRLSHITKDNLLRDGTRGWGNFPCPTFKAANTQQAMPF